MGKGLKKKKETKEHSKKDELNSSDEEAVKDGRKERKRKGKGRVPRRRKEGGKRKRGKI